MALKLTRPVVTLSTDVALVPHPPALVFFQPNPQLLDSPNPYISAFFVRHDRLVSAFLHPSAFILLLRSGFLQDTLAALEHYVLLGGFLAETGFNPLQIISDDGHGLIVAEVLTLAGPAGGVTQ